MTDEILKHFEEKLTNIPESTVLVPPNGDDDCDVKSVEFNDPELMFGKGDPKLTPTEVKAITQFISSYPYSTLTYLCRVLNIKPAGAVTKVMAFEPHNTWWGEDVFADALKKDADDLTAKGWEPGVTPVGKLNKAQAFTLFEHIVKVDVDCDWSVWDMLHRMNLEPEELGAYLVDYLVSELLSQMKYIGGDTKWLFDPETIKMAAVNNSWIGGWPKREVTPYIHLCPACGTFYNELETETVCAACGSPRCFEPERPISIPGKVTTGDLVDLDEIVNL
jgi:hypothetical protein